MNIIPSKQDIYPDDDISEEDAILRDASDVLLEIKDHLTKEELLFFSVYKNSKIQKNQIHQVFLEKYHGKQLTSSAITRRKERLMHVLGHVGALLRFKRSTNVDYKLKQILTKKQYIMLILYERRIPMKDIGEKLGLTKWTKKNRNSRPISLRFYAAMDRLQIIDDADVIRYLELLGNVLKFSRKYPVSKR